MYKIRALANKDSFISTFPILIPSIDCLASTHWVKIDPRLECNVE